MKDKYIDRNGYPRWKNTGILVHRIVAANLIGGKLFPGMIVHHIDGDKLNFRKNNLSIMSRSAHSRLHANKRRITAFAC